MRTSTPIRQGFAEGSCGEELLCHVDVQSGMSFEVSGADRGSIRTHNSRSLWDGKQRTGNGNRRSFDFAALRSG